MRLGNLLERLRVRRMSGSSRKLSSARPPVRRRAVFERLEDRILLSANLYVDYGDAFAGGVLNTTVAAIDSTQSGSNPNIDGPRLTDPSGNNYADDTAVAITSFNTVYGANTAARDSDRATIDQLVQRFYAPLDITVIDLTTTAQTVNGKSVQAATSLDDVSATLGALGSHDSYVFVGLFAIGPTNDNPANFATNGYGGLSTGTDIGGNNNNDGTALVMMRAFANRYSAQFLGDQVAHESGHLFGLRHTFGNNPSSAAGIDSGLLQSDMMSYLAYTTFGGFDVFSRYPMVKGDGNTNNDTLSATPTPFDQMINDPNIEASPNFEYITGTGENDIITIKETGSNQASVSIQAFTDAAFTTAISVPGTAGASTTYSYNINLSKPLLVDAGARNDRIVLDGDFGTTVTVRGMAGQDDLVIDGEGAGTGSYVPGTNTANGLDGNSDVRGTLTYGGTTLNFQEFDPLSDISVTDIGSFIFRTPLANDSVSITSPVAGKNRITGSSGGVTFASLTFDGIGSFTVDTGANDGGVGPDVVSIDAAGLVAAGLQNFTVDAGTGDDLLSLLPASYLLPGGGTFKFLGGTGNNDTIRATADVDFSLNDSSLAIAGGGSVVLSGVERVDLSGGAGNNSFAVSNWSGAATLDGKEGSDTYAVDFVGSGSGQVTVNDTGANATDALNVNGTGGTDALVIDATSVARASEIVTYTGIEDLTVRAKDGADLITVNSTDPLTTVLGGDGEDDIIVNAVGAAGDTLDGQGGSDDYTVNFGALAGVVNVADTGTTGADALLVNGTSNADVLLVAPAFVKRNGTETVNYSGIEELNVDAGGGNDDITVDGTSVPTEVLGGLGDDSFTVNGPMSAPLTLDGGPGTDSLLFNGTSGDDVIILTDSSITGLGANITFISIENLAIDAGAGNDLVDGSALTMSVTIYGGTGDDTLIGGSNDDKLYGQDDNDDLIGNLGNDYLDGGSGSDGLVGDKGTILRELVSGPAQTIAIPSGKLQAVIDRPGTLRRIITLIDPDNGGNDTLLGGAGDDYLHGGAGTDQLDGGEGADALFGDAGDDTLAGGKGDDHLYGGTGNDRLDGGAGADIAYGGDGDDRLVADQSGDRLIDWFGNFNDFVVPGPGYGAPVIVRSPSPWVQDFLLNLASADGAAHPNAEIAVVVPGSNLQQSNSGPGGRT